MKFWAKVILIGFVVSMLFAVASTFAHADNKTYWIQRPDDHGNLYWYPDYIAQDNHDRSHARQQHENRRWKKYVHRQHMEYHNGDTWYYEKPRKRKFKLKPRFFLDIYLE